MLKEADIDRYSRWSDVKRKVDSDPRYKVVESGVQREDWFRDYMIKVNTDVPPYYFYCYCDAPNFEIEIPNYFFSRS